MAEKLAKKESAFDYTAYVGGVLLVIALVFVWRSFYSMRIPTEERSMKTATVANAPHLSAKRVLAPAYLALIQAFPLKPLRSEEELDEAIRIVDSLLIRMKSLTEGEHDYLECLGFMIEIYEEEHYPMSPVDPIAMLEYLIETREVTNSEVARGAGLAVSILSALLNGKRKLTLDHIKRLATYFHTKPVLFIE